MAKLVSSAKVCDVGAGSAHLTKLLVAKGYEITAVEPNDAMREVGMAVTAGKPVDWCEGTGEDTGQASNTFEAVTFGSSFNTTDRIQTLRETKRILKSEGWFACLWNHRDLEYPLRAKWRTKLKAGSMDMDMAHAETIKLKLSKKADYFMNLFTLRPHMWRKYQPMLILVLGNRTPHYSAKLEIDFI